jgi:predicted dehydrogenase
MKSSQEKLTIGIVGLGYWGPNWLRNILIHPNFDLAWIVDTNDVTLEKFKNIYGLSQQQVSSNIDKSFNVKIPDLVLISTPPATHFELGKLALNFGANVIIEKPVGLNTEETQELVKLSTDLKLQLFVDHTYIFTPQAKFIYETLKKGLLGDLQFITSSRLNLGLIQKDVDVIRDLAVHDLALFDYFIPNKLNTVSAATATHLPSIIPSTASINLNYDKNLLAQVGVSWNSPVKVRTMIISGSEKSILWDDTNQSEKIKVYEASANIDLADPNRHISYSLGDTFIPKLDNAEAIFLQLTHIKDVLAGNEKALNGVEHITRVSNVLKALDSSAKNSGSRVAV